MRAEEVLAELVTGAEIARRLRVSRQRVYQLRQRPDFPKPIGRIGKALVWRWAEVKEWSRARGVTATNGVRAPKVKGWEDLAGAWRDQPELGRQIREDQED